MDGAGFGSFIPRLGSRGSAPEKLSSQLPAPRDSSGLGRGTVEHLDITESQDSGLDTAALQGLMSHPWLQEEAPRDHKGCTRSD